MNAIERQRWLRIRLSVAAYAYEFEDTSVMSDGEFDKLSLEVDPKITTGNRKLDDFFRREFHPDTGQWVHKHPEKHKLKHIFNTYMENEHELQ
jgi:hypothetical protein